MPLANRAIAALLEAVAGADDVDEPDDCALALEAEEALEADDALPAALEPVVGAVVVVIAVLLGTTLVVVRVTGPLPMGKLLDEPPAVDVTVAVGAVVVVFIVSAALY